MSKKKEKETSQEEKVNVEEKVKVVRITMENAKDNQDVIIAPSPNIIKFFVDSLVSNGLRGTIIKKDDKFLVRGGAVLIAELEDFLQNEEMYAPEMIA